VTDRTTEVGCGVSSYYEVFDGTTFKTYLVACNYASTNMLTWPVYKSGPVASDCVGGADDVYPGLCKITENIDPNSNDN
jgi:hypothetical protein